MKSKFVQTIPVLAACLAGNGSIALADTSDVKGPTPLFVGKSGKHCKDDPNCFNRIHYAVKPVARVSPGKQFILETRDGLDSEFTFDFNGRGCGSSQPESLPSTDRPCLHRRS